MPVSVIAPFLIYCFINSISPGPANLCSLSAALRYGRQAALRQWRGLATGFTIDSLAAVLTVRLLGAVLGDTVGVLSWIGAVYILWLAWNILRSAGTMPEADDRQPCFLSGLLVNLTNVKVILYCITTLSAFVLPYTDSFWWLLGVGLFLPLTGPSCNLVWLFAGVRLKALFAKHQKTIDILMAIALALCAVNLALPR